MFKISEIVFYDEYISRRLRVKRDQSVKNVNNEVFYPKMIHVKLVNINILMECILSCSGNKEENVLKAVKQIQLIYNQFYSNNSKE